ncbi:molybdopterin converting factor subunit 1 [Alkalicoccus daliensis]|uniref:Molybdopterin synthase sulfur carrier subunit n=1 Tax=Alkalicoccus daliensis TaxID=745820 RepID=A0A1G9ZBD9_9BACI|nr:molybdopterin converting factor subunit 1 [Alkalicoccus daliensis]SDN18614.1 molybdopterin synthase sulfur carrier subunit [Alkalicoccus daliensis]
MIKVLFFAGMKEQAGTAEYELQQKEIAVAEIRAKVRAEFPGVTGTDRAMVAINEEFTNEDDTARTGDVVAFIPPVSGG